jgi:excisionase family DNA binding protein
MDGPRFLTPADAAEVLSTSVAQIMALIRSGDIRAIQIGGRGQWRIETAELEAYIQRQYQKFDARQAESASSEERQRVEGR